MLIYLSSMVTMLIFGFVLYNIQFRTIGYQNNIRFKMHKNKIFSIFAVITFGLIMAFRSPIVGTDTQNYCKIFKDIANMPLRDILKSYEFKSFPLYAIYNKLISFISTNDQCVIMFNSLIIIIGIACFIYYNSDNVKMSWFYYLTFHFYYFAFNAARQSLAMMLILISYHYIKRKRNIKALILLISAVLVHNTAIIFFIVFLLIKIKFDVKKIVLFILIGIIGTKFANILLSFFVTLFPRYAAYLDKGQNTLSSEIGEGKRIIIAFILIGVVLFTLYSLKKMKALMSPEEEYELYLLTSIVTISIIFMFAFRYSGLLARVEMFFSYFVIIYIPKVIEKFLKGNTKMLIYTLSIIVMIIPWYVKLYDYLPYKFFWQ